MNKIPFFRLAVVLLFATACSSSTAPAPDVAEPDEPAVNVPDDPAFEVYLTDATRANRVRVNRSQPGDAEILAQFEDTNPDSPDGYRSLIALNDQIYANNVVIEVIAEVPGTAPDASATRLLRLTTDQAPLEQMAGATGLYYLRGDNFVWVTIDDGPLLSGSDSRGLVDLVLDFDAGTADLNLRTGQAGASVVRTEIVVAGLPFDKRSGAFGGPITVDVHNPVGPEIYKVNGTLRGNVGGTPAYANSQHGLSTAGLYTASGTDQGAVVKIDGAFAGVDPNALAPTP
ncbi:MAG: hypothetical protein II336_19805 [Loktanella sp.]|nr:hypothetical protein [Loktanella sp.]